MRLLGAVSTAWLAVLVVWLVSGVVQSSERSYILRTNPLGGVTHCWVSDDVVTIHGPFVRFETPDGQSVVARPSLITTDPESVKVDPAKCVNGRYGFTE